MLHPRAVRPALLTALLVALGFGPAASAFAQSESPPPPEGAASAQGAPGFEGEDEEDGEETPTAPPQPKKPRGRDDGRRPLPESTGPIGVESPGPNEQLISDLNATRGEITLGELVDEILADVMAELAIRSPKKLSPMAIRQISLGKNIAPGFAKRLKAALVAQLQAATRIVVIDCLECEATRTKIVDGQWVFTRGLTSTAELREIGERIGAKSFLDVDFAFDPESSALEIHFQVIAAEDSRVLWADTFRADETTPMLLRSSESPIRRKERLRDLEMLLEGRPYYGIAASAGFMLLPYDDPAEGDITGASAGFRIYERFGEERRWMYGLDMMGFLNTERLAGAVMSAGLWWIPVRPDLVNPELRVGAKAGAFIAGSEGNAAVFQLGGELLLRYRFGLYVYALFMTKSPFNGNELGGLGFNTGLSWNW